MLEKSKKEVIDGSLLQQWKGTFSHVRLSHVRGKCVNRAWQKSYSSAFQTETEWWEGDIKQHKKIAETDREIGREWIIKGRIKGRCDALHVIRLEFQIIKSFLHGVYRGKIKKKK